MKYYAFSPEVPVSYNLTGKFQSPSQEWTHFTRTLMDYELIVVTDGTAYIQLGQQQYSVAKGECLLCPPPHQNRLVLKKAAAHFTGCILAV